MNTVLALALKWSGAGWIWEKADGYKTNAACVLAILTALAGLGAEVAPILAKHDTAGVLSFLQGLSHNPLWGGLLLALGGLGIGHKIDKNTVAAASPTV